jgi:hypothetical protein
MTNNELETLELDLGPDILQFIGDALGVRQANKYILPRGRRRARRHLDLCQPSVGRQLEPVRKYSIVLAELFHAFRHIFRDRDSREVGKGQNHELRELVGELFHFLVYLLDRSAVLVQGLDIMSVLKESQQYKWAHLDRLRHPRQSADRRFRARDRHPIESFFNGLENELDRCEKWDLMCFPPVANLLDNLCTVPQSTIERQRKR